MLNERGRVDHHWELRELRPEPHDAVGVVLAPPRPTASMVKSEWVAEKQPHRRRRKNQRLCSSEVPTFVDFNPTRRLGLIRLGAEKGNDADAILRPEALFEPRSQSTAEDDVVLHHQICVGLGLSQHEFEQAEKPVRPEP